MNKLTILFLMASSCMEARQVVDKIIVRVNGSSLLKSDLTRPRVSSTPFDLKEAIAQELYFQESARLKMVPSVLEIEKQIASYRTNAGLKNTTDEEFEKHLKETQGFTINGLKKEYTRYIAVSNLLEHEIKNRVFVTTQEIEDYHKKNPEFEEESYKLKTAIIPFSIAATAEEAAKVKKPEWVEYDDWILRSNISNQMSQIFSIKKGQVSDPIKTGHGYQLVQVIDKRPARERSLQERYVDIEKKLREAKVSKFEVSYRKDLLSKASIVYIN